MASELEILSDFIRNELGFRGELDPEADLLERQVLDSFSIVQMAMFIQDQFGIELEAEDLVRANMARLSGMTALIHRRRNAVAEGTGPQG